MVPMHRFATQSVALTLLIPAIDAVHDTKAGCSSTFGKKEGSRRHRSRTERREEDSKTPTVVQVG